MTNTVAIFMILLSSLAFARQSRGEIGSGLSDTDTMRIVKEYGVDSVVISASQQKMINGCWKEWIYQQWDHLGNLKLERTTRYESGINNTCDFTPYIQHLRVYLNRKLQQEYSRQAACDECKADPCGTERRWDQKGKMIYQRSYRKCSFKSKNPASL